MSKTTLTKKIEKELCNFLMSKGKYPCLEVTAGIGWSEDGRVDVMAIDTKYNIYCYEIKVTKSDFLSSAKKTFVGNYNYFVIPNTLLETILPYINDDYKNIGIITYNEEKNSIHFYKNVRKQKIDNTKTNEYMLSMVRSCAREILKLYEIEDDSAYKKLQNEYKEETKKLGKLEKEYQKLTNDLSMLLGGYSWKDELESMTYLYKMSDGLMKFLIQPINNHKKIEPNNNIEIYKIAQKYLKKYLKTYMQINEFPKWLDMCLVSMNKKDICAILSNLSFERDDNFKYIFTEEERQEMRNMYYEERKIANNPYLSKKDKEKKQNDTLETFLKKAKEQYHFPNFVVKAIGKGIPFCLELDNEKRYVILQKGIKEKTLPFVKILLIGLKIDTNGNETYKTIENILTLEYPNINEDIILKTLQSNEIYPITQKEFDNIYIKTMLKNEIPLSQTMQFC